jgi:hypothetical protein
MFVFATLLSAIIGANVVAQTTPAAAPPPATVPAGPDTFNTGACLDSARAVPRVLQQPVTRSMQIVRIDRVVSTSSMMPNEIIGFLYTLHDGSTWLGQRTSDYMSAASATAINQVLASTHLPNQPVSQFPAQSHMGISTKAAQYFRVQVPQGALDALRIRLEPCVAWPDGRELPDPSL